MSAPLCPLIEAALRGLVSAIHAGASADDTAIHLDTVRGAIRCQYRDYLKPPANR
jgi:hypothetical protein